ncbi:MAG: hypothetical protein LC772_06340, partial [Chloroflexi bacterium]|nr:hypothetical protein [Chloroflexota bacterium]
DMGAGPASPTAAGVREDESLEDLYQEFCRTFCHRPGVNFMEFLRAEGVTRMVDWLRPDSPCAIPKGLIRLLVDSTRKGSHLWDNADPIRMRYEGNWDSGGVPPHDSLDALSVLAQIFKKPIKLFYTEKPDGSLMVMEFHP